LARRHGYKAFEAGARRVLASCIWESDLAAARKNLTIAQATAASENMVAELEAIASTHASLRADSTANI
jgi:hypothetical protein